MPFPTTLRRRAGLGLAVAVLLPSLAWAEDAAPVPAVCSPDTPDQALACPRTCLETCEDTAFATQSGAALRMCREVRLKASMAIEDGVDDPESCNAAAPAPVPPGGLPEAWFKDVQAGCNEQFKPPAFDDEDIVKVMSTIPDCLGSVSNLTCRTDAIAAESNTYARIADGFRQLDFDMESCTMAPEQIESALQEAKGFSQPLKLLGDAFEEVRLCQDQIIAWAGATACDPTRPECSLDQRTAKFVELVEKRVEDSIRDMASIETLLKEATATQGEILEAVPFYSMICH